MVELVLGIALAIALWNWAYWMARKKPHHTPYPIRPTYIYVEHSRSEANPEYIQDERGYLWRIENQRVAKRIGPAASASPRTLQRSYIHDGNGEVAEVLFYGPPSQQLPPPYKYDPWVCLCCGNVEIYMRDYCNECGQSRGI